MILPEFVPDPAFVRIKYTNGQRRTRVASLFAKTVRERGHEGSWMSFVKDTQTARDFVDAVGGYG